MALTACEHYGRIVDLKYVREHLQFLNLYLQCFHSKTNYNKLRFNYFYRWRFATLNTLEFGCSCVDNNMIVVHCHRVFSFPSKKTTSKISRTVCAIPLLLTFVNNIICLLEQNVCFSQK